MRVERDADVKLQFYERKEKLIQTMHTIDRVSFKNLVSFFPPLVSAVFLDRFNLAVIESSKNKTSGSVGFSRRSSVKT